MRWVVVWISFGAVFECQCPEESNEFADLWPVTFSWVNC